MPDIKYDKELIMKKLIEYATDNGFEDLSARKLATYIGCSVMPIYTAYGDMGQLIEAARERIVDLIISYMDKEHIEGNPMLNAAIAVVCFARDYEYLYREVFINSADKKSIQRIIDKMHGYIVSTGNTMQNELNAEEMEVFLYKVWITIQGLASMVCSGLLRHASNEFIADALLEMGTNLLRGTLFDKGTLSSYKYYGPMVHPTQWDIMGEKP